MRPTTRFIIYSILLFALFAISLRPYNWFCQTFNMCQQFHLTDLIPVKEGTESLNVIFEAKNKRKDLDFTIEGYDSIVTVPGRKNVVKYRVKNLSKETIYFRPKFYVMPKEYESYINRSECLCFDEHEIEPKEEIELQIAFSIDLDIEQDDHILGYGKLSKNQNPRDIIIGYFAR